MARSGWIIIDSAKLIDDPVRVINISPKAKAKTDDPNVPSVEDMTSFHTCRVDLVILSRFIAPPCRYILFSLYD
jgi:hypothetical protein